MIFPPDGWIALVFNGGEDKMRLAVTTHEGRRK